MITNILLSFLPKLIYLQLAGIQFLANALFPNLSFFNQPVFNQPELSLHITDRIITSQHEINVYSDVTVTTDKSYLKASLRGSSLVGNNTDLNKYSADYTLEAQDIADKDTEARPSLQEKPAKDPHSSAQLPEIIGLYALGEDRNRFLSVTASGQVSIWSLKTNSQYIVFPSGSPVTSCDYFQKTALLAINQDTQIILFSLKEKKQLLISPRLGTKSSSIVFAPDGNSLLAGGEDGKVYRWVFNLDKDNPQSRVERYIGHSSSITALVFHPYNRFFFSADSFGSISAWQTYDKDLFAGQYDKQKSTTTFYAEAGKRVQTTAVDNSTVLNMRVSADGQNLFSALQDGRVEWRIVRGLKLIVTGVLNSGALYDIQLSPDARRLASIARDGKLRVWNIRTIDQKTDGKIKDQEIVRYNNMLPDSSGYFELYKEIELPDVRKILFLDSSNLVVGEQTGRLLEVKL